MADFNTVFVDKRPPVIDAEWLNLVNSTLAGGVGGGEDYSWDAKTFGYHYDPVTITARYTKFTLTDVCRITELVTTRNVVTFLVPRTNNGGILRLFDFVLSANSVELWDNGGSALSTTGRSDMDQYITLIRDGDDGYYWRPVAGNYQELT